MIALASLISFMIGGICGMVMLSLMIIARDSDENIK